MRMINILVRTVLSSSMTMRDSFRGSAENLNKERKKCRYSAETSTRSKIPMIVALEYYPGEAANESTSFNFTKLTLQFIPEQCALHSYVVYSKQANGWVGAPRGTRQRTKAFRAIRYFYIYDVRGKWPDDPTVRIESHHRFWICARAGSLRPTAWKHYPTNVLKLRASAVCAVFRMMCGSATFAWPLPYGR